MGMDEETQVRTVSELTRAIRNTLESGFGTVWVEGEISNHRLQSSGHHYFTLKDSGAQISCVFFRGMAARSRVRLEDGLQLQVQGELSVYEPRGQYQLVVKSVQAKGQGSLQAQFEALKRKLFEEGLFDEERKRPIPAFPSVVALVTSPTGAAIRDMLNVLTRRAPWVRVLVYPVKVQGAGAAEEIAAALEKLNSAENLGLPVPDTIVVGRGGGSLEDLWAFNEEIVARAIAASKIPVVSAVGHEIDFAISDFVADLRAPTPSAAAELLAPDQAELRRRFESLDARLRQRIRGHLDRTQQVVELLARGPLATTPERLLMRAEQEVDEWQNALEERAEDRLRELEGRLTEFAQTLERRHPRLLLAEAGHRFSRTGEALRSALDRRLERITSRIDQRAAILRNLGPEAVLKRGFSFTMRPDGRVIQKASEVNPGDRLRTRLADGEIESVAE